MATHFHSFCDTCTSDERHAIMAYEMREFGKTYPPGSAFETRQEAEEDNRLFETPGHENVVVECDNTCMTYQRAWRAR